MLWARWCARNQEISDVGENLAWEDIARPDAQRIPAKSQVCTMRIGKISRSAC